MVWIIVLIILAILIIAGGIYVKNRRYGKKTRGSMQASYHPEAQKDADGDKPYATQDTKPENMGFVTRLSVDGKEVPVDSYMREKPVNFGEGDEYTGLEGIVTFRGNNYRDTASYGNPVIRERKLDPDYWHIGTGFLEKSDISKGKGSAVWSGSGWTGQPMIVRWDEQTRKVMNLYPDKKEKEGLVEAIYATMDGNVYFIDIEDGTPTRDTLTLGLPFKGAGAIDPRGIPMLFAGAGDSLPDSYGEAGYARAFFCSLTNFDKMYELGAKDPFSPRIFHGYDSSALVHAQTDTLFYPGENAIIYSMRLNTKFDNETGKLSIDPSEMVKWTYNTDRTSEESYWWGMEDSAVIWKQYMYIADNGGNMMCMDLNTMQLVWTQDTLDDTNASPVFEEEADGSKYLYVAPSLHWQKSNATNTGKISIFKMNAINGEIVWEKPYDVHTVYGVSGGVQATPVLGKGSISDLLIVPVARMPYKPSGILVALDKKTGEERWVFDMKAYAWSSPVAVYAQDGTAYIVQCDSKGNVFLIDGLTGKVCDRINVGANVEASPAVFENTIVVGTRGSQIVGIKIR
ncbi:MAG: PQQ-binding-like beta-propeller repeat protein [Christensenella sp.]|uniref:outer membrane protein assembly factor BamB family protein n=1 Tax=Christensenella sp. TaxID=1935934 RepID=UPI002B21E855|nr:PQQ-binding-like beta-propeller repeat protein [Christensenella sp.]MEA5003260.1 PQQ-binding-like beta-propeller repeat protein [Christensenella sp.]